MGLTEGESDSKNSALLHDIGKVEIPESVLNKSGPLTNRD
jgi:HD-GYP domain-containing protein (c-di-GMP phosphodiesterase class II)